MLPLMEGSSPINNILCSSSVISCISTFSLIWYEISYFMFLIPILCMIFIAHYFTSFIDIRKIEWFWILSLKCIWYSHLWVEEIYALSSWGVNCHWLVYRSVSYNLFGFRWPSHGICSIRIIKIFTSTWVFSDIFPTWVGPSTWNDLNISLSKLLSDGVAPCVTSWWFGPFWKSCKLNRFDQFILCLIHCGSLLLNRWLLSSLEIFIM